MKKIFLYIIIISSVYADDVILVLEPHSTIDPKYLDENDITYINELFVEALNDYIIIEYDDFSDIKTSSISCEDDQCALDELEKTKSTKVIYVKLTKMGSRIKFLGSILSQKGFKTSSFRKEISSHMDIDNLEEACIELAELIVDNMGAMTFNTSNTNSNKNQQSKKPNTKPYSSNNNSNDIYKQIQKETKGITISAGFNMSKLKFESGELTDFGGSSHDLTHRTGYSLYIEKPIGGFIIGGGIIERGGFIEFETIDYYFYYGEYYEEVVEVEVEWIFNYYTGYILLPLYTDKVLTIYSGLQVGKIYDGYVKSDGESIGLGDDLDDFNLDYGGLISIDYWLKNGLGIRASYYYGLQDVLEDGIDFTNQAYSLNLMYTL